MQQLVLSDGWQVKERSPNRPLADDFRSENGWLAATVPGTAHEALWAAGQMGSPYSITEQERFKGLAERDFLFRCRFALPEGFAPSDAVRMAEPGRAVQLFCDGLDTIATVWLNGHEILRSDNMFLPSSALVTRILHARDNDLWILFESALRIGKARESRHGQRPVWNGDGSRVYVRKAQYQYGWDFGPTLLSTGPWQPVRLVAFSARIAEIKAPLTVAADLATAQLPVTVCIERAPGHSEPLTVQLALHSPGGHLVHQSSHSLTDCQLDQHIQISAPELWWPHGHGDQRLYRLTVSLRSAGDGSPTLDQRELRLGARRLRLCQPAISDGEAFYFEINNRPIFCGGANWIPPDLLPTRISAARYQTLLCEAIADGMTMLRIWGGGIYESDVFYDLCDELGVLVWQDFLFACGMYPGGDGPEYDNFASSVAAEATAAICRLRHHASLVIWAGNNEDYSIAASQKAFHGPQDPIPAPGPSSLKQPIFDGRRLYEEVLARACAEHDPSRPYWPGSPYSRKAIDPSAQTEGDRHIWEVWHFPMLDYQDYGRVGGRFASEFGMQAVPDLPTLRKALGDRPIEQQTLALLNKGQDGPERIKTYIERNLPAPKTLEDYLYSTQLIQAEALAYAVRTFRRQFDASRRCSGALIWQFDDCWPGVSWSMLEFCDEGEPVRRKPSIYAVRRELTRWAVGLAPAGDSVSVWTVTPPDAQTRITLRLRAFALDGRCIGVTERGLAVVANQANELGDFTFPGAAEPLVYGAQILVEGQVVARAVLWPQPLRLLALGDPGLDARRDGDTLHLSVKAPAKAVLIGADSPLDFSDNLLDLLPDEPIAVRAPGLGGVALQIRSLFGAHECL